MKKITTLLTMLLMLSLCFALTACELGDKAITSIQVDHSSYVSSYNLGDPYDFSGIKVIANYNDDSTKELAFEDLTIGSFSTDAVGEFNIEVSYQEFKTYLRVNVIDAEAPNYTIVGFELPEAYLQGFVSAKNGNENKEAEFMNHAEMTYKVGDDNPFVFLPNITGTGLDGDDALFTVNGYKSVNRVYEKIEGAYVELTGDDLTAVVIIDDNTSQYDFTEEACGRSFRLEVSPYYAPALEPVSIDFDVVDGWNVYSAVDLSRVDNKPTNAAAWADYKAAHGVDNTAINGVILHTNIVLTVNDLPSSYFYGAADGKAENVVGTMKDGMYLYHRDIAATEHFNLYGNGYMIDASTVPTIHESEYGTDFSNASLFKFDGKKSAKEDADVTSTVGIYDISFRGNGHRTNDQQTLIEDRGGVILVKAYNVDTTIKNIIAKSFFISIFPETFTVMDLNQSRVYDSLQDAVFVWSGATLNVNGCELKRAGGPLFILQNNNLDKSENYEYYIPTVNISDDTVIQSIVSGQEAWFQAMQLTSTITQLQGLSAGLEQASGMLAQAGALPSIRTLYGANGFNLISVLMSDGVSISTASSGVQGQINIGDAIAADMMRDGYKGSFLNASHKAIVDSFTEAAPVFISTSTPDIAVTTLDGTSLTIFQNGQVLTAGSPEYAMALATFFAGDYVALYQYGMCITLGMQNK